MKKYVTHFLFVFVAVMMLLTTNIYAEETQEYVHTCNAGYIYGAEGGMIVEHCTRMTDGCDHEAKAFIEYRRLTICRQAVQVLHMTVRKKKVLRYFLKATGREKIRSLPTKII